MTFGTAYGLTVGTFINHKGGLTFKSSTNRELFGRDLAKWYEKESNSEIDSNNYACIGVYRDNILKGVIVYVNYTGASIDIHVHIPGLLKNRQTIRELFKYPFGVAGVINLRTRLPRSHKKIIKILLKLGFIEETVLKEYYGLKKDQLIFCANRKNIEKWMK